MSLKKAWTIQCDSQGCNESIIFNPITWGEKADYGMAANDAGWKAAPAQEETFCPQHWNGEHELDGEPNE